MKAAEAMDELTKRTATLARAFYEWDQAVKAYGRAKQGDRGINP